MGRYDGVCEPEWIERDLLEYLQSYKDFDLSKKIKKMEHRNGDITFIEE
jgi:hypothetical protein